VWLRIADDAVALGEPRLAVEGSLNVAMSHVDDAPRDISRPLATARDMTTAYGLVEDGGWVLYAEAEAAFAAGDWSRALDRAVAAMDVGEANEYLRLTVRAIHVAVPIASIRGDRAILERAARWYRSLQGRFEFPDSPYARVVRVAQDLELADAGLWPRYLPDVEPRLAAFANDPGGPSWSAALDRVTRAWIEAGALEGAQRAIDETTAYFERGSTSSHLGRGTYNLMRARLATARGDREAVAEAGTQTLAEFRVSDAPWWSAKAIRQLERARVANSAQVAEVEDIERHLGAIRPTP